MVEQELTQQFSKAESVTEIWSAARQIMAKRLLPALVDDPLFLSGFDRLEEFASVDSDIDRLLAIDLLVRLPAASKKLANRAEAHLSSALTRVLPPLYELHDASRLPDQAKPADIRENIAIGLKLASGKWVEDYLSDSIVYEQQSQRTREALITELVQRTESFNDLIRKLQASFERNTQLENDENRKYADLHSICQALIVILSRDRQAISVDMHSPCNLDLFAASLVKQSRWNIIPPRLEEAATVLVRLLDELLTLNVQLFVESDSYLVVERISRWWNHRSYPEALRTAMRPIMSKLIGAITVRARMGQKSQELVTCLRCIVQDADRVTKIREKIAESTNISPEVDDWLRGKQRTTGRRTNSLRRALRSGRQESTDQLIGRLLISTEYLDRTLDEGDAHAARAAVATVVNRVKSAALRRQLKMEGIVGEIVEYVAAAHETVDQSTPLGHKVRVESPMVVRIREDGSRDVVVKAEVVELEPIEKNYR